MNKNIAVKDSMQMKFTSALAILIPLLLVNVPALAENPNELILYEFANFEGERIVFKLRSHENYRVINNLGDYHQDLINGVSSFQIGSNVKVWFFRERHLFDGYHRSFPANESIGDLNHFNLNDDIESLVLFKKDLGTPPGAMLYKDPDFRGTSVFLPTNRGYSQLVNGSLTLSNKIRDTISSLKLLGGVTRIFLYEHECFEGRVLEVTGDVKNLKERDFDNTAGSASVGHFCTTQPQHIGAPCWLTKPSSINLERDVDLLVRTVNILGESPCLTRRLLGIARLFHQEFPQAVGVIGMQELREVEDCKNDGQPASSAECFASIIKKLYGVDSTYSSVRGRNGIVAGDPWRIVESNFWELGTKWWNLGSLLRCRRNAWPSYRYLLETKLVHIEKGWTLRFYCTHLTRASECEREEQAKRVTAIIRRRAEPGELPPVLVGDFNAGRYLRSAGQPEESVLEMEKYFYRPTDRACGQNYTGIDLIYVGKKSAFPESQGHFVPIKTNPVYFLGLQTRIDGFPEFCAELTDHHANGVSLKIVTNSENTKN